MPYDGSGNYTRVHNWSSDRDADINIQANRVDQENDDIAAAFNQVILRSGVAPMTGSLNLGGNSLVGLATGNAGTPSIRFQADGSTGFYLNGAGRLAFSSGGTRRFEVGAAGVSVVGTFSVSTTSEFTGNVSMAGNLDLTGNLTVNGTVTLAQPLTAAEVTGTLEVGGAVTFNTTLQVVGAADFDNNVNIDGNLVVDGASTLTGSVTSESFFRSATGGQTVTVQNNGVTSLITGSGPLHVLAGGANPLAFFTNGIARFTIDGATGAASFSGAVSGASTISDSIGNVRKLVKAPATSGVLTAAAANRIVRATGGVTIDNNVFAENDSVSILNKSGVAITITQGADVTMTDTNGAVGNRTLANNGWVTIWFNSASDCHISGAGLT